MNVLLISPFLPDPEAAAGAPRAIYDRVRLLAREHRVTLVSLMEPGQEPRRRCAAGVGARVYAVLRPAAARRSAPAAWRRRLGLAAGLLARGRPVLVQEFGSMRLCALVASLVREERFHVVLVEHALAAQYIDCLGQDARPVIFTDHDVRASFPERRPPRPASLLSRLRLPFDLLDRALWRRYARRAYRSAGIVSVPTVEDAQLVRAQAPGVRVEVVPFGMAIPAEPGGGGEREPDTLLFVGNYDHPPNRDAAVWLGSEIMPLVWARRPEARLWLVGRNPTPEVRALAGDRVTVTGEVPSVREYLERCSLFVAPLRLGGGMRIKLIEALAAGTPVVTTPLGSRGFGAEPGRHLRCAATRHLLVAGTAREFAEAVACALGDPALRARLGAAGRDLVEAELNEGERAARLNGLMAEVAGGRRL